MRFLLTETTPITNTSENQHLSISDLRNNSARYIQQYNYHL